MAGPLLIIIKKEVREMVRDPRLLLGMVIVPLLIFPLMGMAMSASVSSVEDSVSHIEVGIVNQDQGNRSGELISHLVEKGVLDSYPSFGEMQENLSSGECQVALYLVIMPGFTEAIDSNGSGTVSLYTPMETYSIGESAPSDIVAGYVLEYQQEVLDERIAAAYPDAEVSDIMTPVAVGSYAVIDGQPVQNSPSEITNQMMTQSIMIPMVLMILLIMAAQLAATSVAMEKEEKTLETLLTTPVPRSTILMGKIAGVVVISAIAVVAYMLGFAYYMSSMTSISSGGASIDLASIGLAPNVGGMAVLLATLFLSLVSALSLSVLVASFTEDVRTAQSLLGVLYVPIFIPALVLMFVDIGQLPAVAQGCILAIPFTYPVLAAKAMYTGEYALILAGIVYQVIFTGAVIYAASKFFSSEKILTSRLRLKSGKTSSGSGKRGA